MDTLIQQLKDTGTARGLCRPWRLKLKEGMSVEQMATLYIQGIDFCISEDYPTLGFLRSNFKGQCEPFGIFVDDVITERINAPDTVLNGECRAMLEYDNYSVSRVYARHNSQLSINVSDNATVTVDAFDDAIVVVATAGTNARVLVNLYGNAQVECFGSGIQVKHKNKLTY